jgi:putative cardiolipin synthase
MIMPWPLESPVESQSLCRHAKLMVIDRDQVLIGSANFDPRSLRINTEMGLLIESTDLNTQPRQLVGVDFYLRKAWQVELDEQGKMIRVSDTESLHHQPTTSFMRRIEDCFLSLMSVENEM